MKRGELDDLVVFVTIARTRSFTRAAAELGLSPSALSHAIRGLEARLGPRLLVQVLDDWCVSRTGLHLYYPSRQVTPRAQGADRSLEAGRT
jgi:DNA-binding transcriptional LysR family regulator